MTTISDKRAGRVLVILTGGNIGLMASTDSRNSETVLTPAKVTELKALVLGDEHADSVRLRERSLAGFDLHVDFVDLRQNERRRYADPEEFDSAQVDPALWAALARKIKDGCEQYEGFVILHGLDTMAYTASALAFMLQNLPAPVILTGSQRPLNFPRTDAMQNIYSALTLAAGGSLGIRPVIPEVTVYSYDTLFRGSRVSMMSASSYRSFDSPNFPPLATVGEHIETQAHLIRRRGTSKVMSIRETVDAKVVILDVFPGMDAGIFANLNSSAVKGVLLRTYGMGTAPTSADVLAALQALSDAGIVVMNVTQARSGRISHGEDPVSLRLFEQGVISGVDMTAEAAYAKMVIVLSDSEVNPDEAGDLLQLDICGEQSQSIYYIHYTSNNTVDEDDAGGNFALLQQTRNVVNEHALRNLIPYITHMQLRFLGVEPVRYGGKQTNRMIELDVSLVDPTRKPKELVAQVRHDTLRWFAKGRNTINIAYDISAYRDRLLSEDRIPSTLIRLQTNEPVQWKRAAVVIYVSAGAALSTEG